MNNSRPLKSIRLQLARSKQRPEGSQNHGYQFVAPLDAEGHIDPEAWKSHRDQCRVRRFWQGEEDQTGRLVHKPGGAEHARWMFDYDPQRDDDDESGYRFGAHKFAPGEYVSIAPDSTVLEAVRIMLQRHISGLPVVDKEGEPRRHRDGRRFSPAGRNRDPAPAAALARIPGRTRPACGRIHPFPWPQGQRDHDGRTR